MHELPSNKNDRLTHKIKPEQTLQTQWARLLANCGMSSMNMSEVRDQGSESHELEENLHSVLL